MYNHECPYQVLDNRTPGEVKFDVDRGTALINLNSGNAGSS